MTSQTNAPQIYLPDIIGRGYGKYWRYKGRYRVCKGSRSSKKSATTALYYIYNMMKQPEANLLVVRKTYRTLKDSCFKQLKWAAGRLGVSDLWEFRSAPMEAEYKPTGQRIYFRGLDDPLKITSITVEKGVLCWLWIEEAYEITSETDFDTLDESIRGATPPGLFKQATLTFNPWNERHWLKARFFDKPDEDTLAMTTDYRCNEWLDEADIKNFERMKRNNPRRYQVAGLGNWGVVEGLVFENWREENFDVDEIRQQPDVQSAFGLDFGYTRDPSALACLLVSQQQKKIWIFDELYKPGLTNAKIAEEVTEMGYSKEHITADSAEPKSIDELKRLGLRVSPAAKGPDSIRHGIQWLQEYEIIIHPRCTNALTEISMYTWATDRFGQTLPHPIDDYNHFMDALRYATEKFRSKAKPKVKTLRGGI